MRATAPHTRPFGSGEDDETLAPDDVGPTSPGHSADGRDVAEKHHRKGSLREEPGVSRRGRVRTPARG